MTEPVIEIRNLSKRLGGHAVLRNVDADADAGDIVGVLGKNGAGKTTLLEVLLGFSPASEGQTRILGHDSMRLPESVKRRIGFVPQQDELLGMLTGEQLLRTTACFYPDWNPALVERLARDWDVPRRERITNLSVGERQKLSLLLALGHEPDLLVLDEPVASLDPIARRHFLQQLWDLAADARKTVLFSSHIVSDLERAANKVWIVKDGELVWRGALDALKESVVRLHIRACKPFAGPIDVPNLLTSRADGTQAVATVTNWQAGDRAQIERRIGAEIDVEPLTLEDIFVELHR